MPVLTKRQPKKLSQEELLDYAEKVGNIKKSVIDLNSKFDNITNKFKVVSVELRETKEERTRAKQGNVGIKARLTQMEILTNNAAQ